MWICSREFHVPKPGAPESEYEDAFFPGSGFARGISRFRCAVADGASESAFSREWAQLLVRAFGGNQLNVERLGKLWDDFVQKKGTLPWYLESKIRHGSHAALVGLSVQDPINNGNDGGKWIAIAVGDSCLFHVRHDQLQLAGPVQFAADFDNSPYLVSTKTRALKRSEEHVTILSGTWQSKDAFYLATDALAQWILAEHEAGRPPWKLLCDLGSESERLAFPDWIAELREGDLIHNDDTTLVRVEVV